jgi:hypothetical protein
MINNNPDTPIDPPTDRSEEEVASSGGFYAMQDYVKSRFNLAYSKANILQRYFATITLRTIKGIKQKGGKVLKEDIFDLNNYPSSSLPKEDFDEA